MTGLDLSGIGPCEIVLVSYSRTLLEPLLPWLPADSVLLIEDPVVAVNREVAKAAESNPLIGRLLLIEYQELTNIDALVAAEPRLRSARAVLPGIEYAVESAARLASLLGLPGAGTGAAAVFRNKALQRRTAAAAGLYNPRFAVVGSAAEASAFVDEVGVRCVVKPTARQASLGVRFVSPHTGEAAAAFEHANAAEEVLLAPAAGIRSEVIVEEAVSGPEYSVEMLVRQGRACFANVTAKQLVPGDYPVELGHTVPGARTDEEFARLVEATTRLFTAAGFETGLLHCELILGEHGPTLVECAARLPGDEITTLISLAFDRSFVLGFLMVMLGEDPQLPVEPSYGATIRFLTPAPGMVTEVTGVEEVAAMPGVELVSVTAQPGDRISSIRSSWDRVGYLVLRSADAAQAQQDADRAANAIVVTTAP
jgi:biotin carboxylase